MVSPINSHDFATLDDVLNSLFHDGEDINDRVKRRLEDIVKDSNNEVSMSVRRFSQDIDLKPGGIFFSKCRTLAIRYAKATWFESISDFDHTRMSNELYRQGLEELQKDIRAEPAGRARPRFYARNYQRESINTPSAYARGQGVIEGLNPARPDNRRSR